MTSEERYLVAYDIADPKRLRRVARCLEKVAMRVQKSVFLFRGTKARLSGVLDRLQRIIDPQRDVVQAWRMPAGQSADGFRRGVAVTLFPEVAVLEGSEVYFVGKQAETADESGRTRSD